MVMRGGGRNREIQRLQAAAAQNGGEGTARQQQRMEYLQNHKQAGRRPQGPQTGGPWQQAIGNLGRAAAPVGQGAINNANSLMDAMGPGGQEAIRTQQPWNGVGGRMGTGTTWDGQAPMNAYGSRGGAGFDPGHPNQGTQADFDAYKAARGAANDAMQAHGNYKDPIAGQLRQAQAFAPPTEQQRAENQRMQEAVNQRRQELSAGRPGDPNQFVPMQRPTPGQVPPMQRPTPGGAPVGNDPGFYRPMDPAQMEQLKQWAGAPARATQNPNTIAGQGVGAGRFQTDGMRAPEGRSPVGNQFAGGGDPNMNRFSKFGSFVPPARPVAGDQIRGGGSPGLSRRRVNTNNGVLAPPPGKIVPY